MNTRELIIRTAFEHFLQHGYETTSMNDLVKTSGVSKGAFYHYFTSKEALLKATLESYFLAYFPKVSTELPPSLEEAVAALWQPYAALFAAVANISDDTLSYYQYLFTGMRYFPELRGQLKTINQQTQAYLEAALERALAEGDIRPTIQPSTAAAQIIRLIEGTGIMIAIEQTRPEQTFKMFVQAFVETLR